MAGFSVNIGADITQLTTGLNQAAAEVQNFNNTLANTPTSALNTLNTTVQATNAHFDELAASAAALARIEAAINQAAEAATSAGPRFDTLGGRLPLQDFNVFSTSVNRLRTDIASGLVPQISRIPNALSPVTPTADNAANALNRVRPGANQAAAALTNVGRVAQDLPFGFIGIANNLNPLLESFQRLRAETGSSRAAMQALGSSLIGAGGLGIAVSIVTAALSFASIGLQAWGVKNEEAKKKSDALKSALDNIYSSTAKEVAQVDTLVAVLRNETETRERRLGAIKQLQSIAPDIFKSLKLEGDAVIGLDNAYKAYLANLENVIAVKLLQNKLETLIEQRLKKQGNALVGPEAFGSLRQMREELQSLKDVQRGGGIVDPEMIRRLEANIKRTESTLTNLDKQIDETMQRITALSKGVKIPENHKEEDTLSKQLSLLEKIRDAQKEFTGKMFDLKNIDEATGKLAKLEQQVGDLKLQIAVRDAKKAGLPASEIEKLKDAIKLDTQKRLNEAFEKEALLLEFSTKLKISSVERLDINEILSKVFTSKEKIILTLGEKGVQVKVKKESVDVSDLQGKVAKATGLDKTIPIITLHEVRIKILGAKLTNKIEFREKIAKELNDALNDALKNLKIDAISSVADALGEALAGGDIQNVFKSLFSVIAAGLQQFGKALIAYGVAQKAFQLATKSLNPALAIAAGAGLIIAGAALKASLPKFATGGIISGPVIGQIGEMHRPEVIMPLDRLPQMLRSIWGGGGNDLQYIPIINNEGLYLAVQRGARRAGRKF